MGHEHKRLIRRNRRRGRNDPFNRLLERDRPINRFHRFRKVVPPSGTAGATTYHRKRQGMEIEPTPSTIDILDECQLLAKHPSALVPAPVVVPQNQRHGKGQLPKTPGQSEISITEITDKQDGIRLQPLQQLLIHCAPGAMQVPGDGEMKIGQSPCLGCRHPARFCPR